MPKLITLGKTEAVDQADDKAAIGLEWIATAALLKSADWAKYECARGYNPTL